MADHRQPKLTMRVFFFALHHMEVLLQRFKNNTGLYRENCDISAMKLTFLLLSSIRSLLASYGFLVFHSVEASLNFGRCIVWVRASHHNRRFNQSTNQSINQSMWLMNNFIYLSKEILLAAFPARNLLNDWLSNALELSWFSTGYTVYRNKDFR